MVTAQIFGIIRDVIVSCAAIITAGIAIYGIKKWKSELRGTKYFEVSFKLLKIVYALRDRFLSARSSYTSVNEMLPKTGDMSNYETESLRYVLSNRFKYVQETLNEFYSCLPEAEALFGKGFKQTCMKINALMWDYQDKINSYVQLWGNTNNDEHLQELSNAVYYRAENDTYKKRLDDIIEKIEAEVTKHIKTE